MTIRAIVIASELPPGPGGIGTHAYELARALSGRGHLVRVLAAQDYVADRERRSFNERAPFEVETLCSGRTSVTTGMVRLRQIRRAVSAFGPDVVIASGMRVVWLASVALRNSEIPWIAVGHGLEFGLRSGWQQALTGRAFTSADAVVCVSAHTRTAMAEAGIHPARTLVIHNGADADRFGPDAVAGKGFRRRHGLGSGPLILTVGQVWERKGQQVVVEALPRLLEVVPDVRYVLVGQPTDGEAIQARARRLGVADRVVLLGQLPGEELGDAYNACDVFCMTSVRTAGGDFEGFGIAVVEAALCAKPSVVSSGSGLEEAVAPGKTALVAEIGSASSTADALALLLGDEVLRAQMGARARERAVREQTWNESGERYEELFDSLVPSVPPRSTDAGPPPVARRMVVVSHTPYHRSGAALVGFGPTVRELDHLAGITGELVHVAPVHHGPAPASSLAHEATNLTVVPVLPAGGPTLRDKVAVARTLVTWAFTIRREIRRADAVHVRCPAAIALVALTVMTLTTRPRRRWVKYAGNWRPDRGEALSYRFQRWVLRRHLPRARVTVNGCWPGDPSHVRPFDNPTLTGDELQAGRKAAAVKSPGPPTQLLFVGRMESEKGVGMVLETAGSFEVAGVPYELELVGEGPMQADAEQFRDRGRADRVRVHGPLPRSDVEQLVARAHIILLPTTASEGFPKVLAEAMAFGAVPVTSAVSSIPQVLEEVGCGVAIDPLEVGRFTEAVLALATDPARWTRQSEAGVAGAERFSYETYLGRVRGLLAELDGSEGRGRSRSAH